MTNLCDRAQDAELEEWARNQQRPAQPDSGAWKTLSAKTCLGCGQSIPDARREAVPGVQLCIHCQADAEFELKQHRGSRA